MKVWDAKPEEAKVRKFDQVSRLPLFPYHHNIWKKCLNRRDSIPFILYRCVILKKYSRDTGRFWQVSFLYAKMGNKTSRDRFSVLELARIENNQATLDETITDVSKNFDLCIDMFRKPIEEKHQTLKVNKNIRYPYLYMDDARLSEITINILSNAVKYTGEGGNISCTLNQYPGEKEGWSVLELIIADNGIGMSEEFQKHIFESFSQERSSSNSGIEGSGLGMGIVKKLVDLTKSSKSPASIAKSNKQWVGTCLYQEACKRLLINCGAVIWL